MLDVIQLFAHHVLLLLALQDQVVEDFDGEVGAPIWIVLLLPSLLLLHLMVALLQVRPLF